MRMREFIRKNRKELDECIRDAVGDPKYRINDEERQTWVLNDEVLYNWAKREGVPV